MRNSCNDNVWQKIIINFTNHLWGWMDNIKKIQVRHTHTHTHTARTKTQINVYKYNLSNHLRTPLQR